MTVLVDSPDFTLYVGDVREQLAHLPAGSVDCVVTSPPYWGLRDYSVNGQLGLEPTPDAYVENMVAVFREVRRVLAGHGTCWVNLGDSYASGPYREGETEGRHTLNGRYGNADNNVMSQRRSPVPVGLKPKDLVGIPWRVAFALQADGWYLRADIIWGKPNPMPESVTDRPTKAHEYVFLLSKRPRYWFDQEAVREDGAGRLDRGANGSRGRLGTQGWTGEPLLEAAGRNVRSVWEIATQPYAQAHFATYPEELVRRCLLAGCPAHVLVCPSCQVRYVHDNRVRELPGGVRAEVVESPPTPEVLLSDLREFVQREQETAAHNDDQGLRRASHEGTPGSDEAGVRDGAPRRDGTDAWASTDEGRGSSPPERREGGQQAGEPRSDAETSARSEAEEATEDSYVPGVRSEDRTARRELRCGRCQGRLVEQPGVVLDPFVGSGTTALVARKHGRRCVGIELNPAYAQLALERNAQQTIFAEAGA